MFPTTVFGGSPAFTADLSIGERWGKPVNVLPANSQSDYEAIGVFAGGKPLYVASRTYGTGGDLGSML
jgi:hypothetical protein